MRRFFIAAALALFPASNVYAQHTSFHVIMESSMTVLDFKTGHEIQKSLIIFLDELADNGYDDAELSVIQTTKGRTVFFGIVDDLVSQGRAGQLLDEEFSFSETACNDLETTMSELIFSIRNSKARHKYIIIQTSGINTGNPCPGIDLNAPIFIPPALSQLIAESRIRGIFVVGLDERQKLQWLDRLERRIGDNEIPLEIRGAGQSIRAISNWNWP